MSVWEGFIAYFAGVEFLYSPLYLVSSAAIAAVIWWRRGGAGGLLAFLMPRDLYRHPSSWIDIKVTLMNFTIGGFGLLSIFLVAPAVTYSLLIFLNRVTGVNTAAETTVAGGIAVAVLLFLVQDFCRYVTHYLHHRSPILWPFHAVHHSAEVLTPITFMRAHPVYHIVQRLIISLFIGSTQAVVLYVLVGQIELWVIYLNTLAFGVYLLTGVHLRHSHVALRYGYILEHILISPAQHQIHHSCDRKHFDKNFGEIFAIWDWMFGTLYIPERDENLTFGIPGKDGRRAIQPYPTLRDVVAKPFAESFAVIRDDLRRLRREAGREPQRAPDRSG